MDNHNNVKQHALKVYAKHVAREFTELLGALKAARTATAQVAADKPEYEQNMADAINALCNLEGKDKVGRTDIDDIEDEIFDGYHTAMDLLAQLDDAIGDLNNIIDEL